MSKNFTPPRTVVVRFADEPQADRIKQLEIDRFFVGIVEAEQAGLLPQSKQAINSELSELYAAGSK